MTVHLHETGLSYFSVPKCGCTTLKSLFFEYEHGLTFEAAQEAGHPAASQVQWVHGVYPSRPFAETGAESPPAAWRVAVVRDPFSLIVSCYRNRVRTGKGHRLMHQRVHRMRAADLSPDPTLETFVDRLEDYRATIGDIAAHSMPLSHFLGTEPERFDRIYPLRDLSRLHADLAARLGPLPPLGWMQTRGPRMSADALSPAARSKI